MTAARLHKPEGPSGIKLDKDVSVPEVGDGEVLVKVASSSLNPVGPPAAMQGAVTSTCRVCGQGRLQRTMRVSHLDRKIVL